MLSSRDLMAFLASSCKDWREQYVSLALGSAWPSLLHILRSNGKPYPCLNFFVVNSPRYLFSHVDSMPRSVCNRVDCLKSNNCEQLPYKHKWTGTQTIYKHPMEISGLDGVCQPSMAGAIPSMDS